MNALTGALNALPAPREWVRDRSNSATLRPGIPIANEPTEDNALGPEESPRRNRPPSPQSEPTHSRNASVSRFSNF